MQIINKAKRRLGIPGRRALLLDPGQSELISEKQLEEMKKNRTVARWIQSGVLLISEDGSPAQGKIVNAKQQQVKVYPGERKVPVHPRDTNPAPNLPDGIKGKGAEFNHLGGGWWEVYINGFKVTDKNVRRQEADSIAADYYGS